MYTVTISERGKPPVKLDFDKPEITIGRVRGNDIVLQKNNVSKRHAKLLVKDAQFIIIDQKSTNGTIVNARKITAPQVVREDDKICIGDFILTLKHHEVSADSISVPPMGPPPSPAPDSIPSPAPAASAEPLSKPLAPPRPPTPSPPPPVPSPPPPVAPSPPPPVASPSPPLAPPPPPPVATSPPAPAAPPAEPITSPPPPSRTPLPPPRSPREPTAPKPPVASTLMATPGQAMADATPPPPSPPPVVSTPPRPSLSPALAPAAAEPPARQPTLEGFGPPPSAPAYPTVRTTEPGPLKLSLAAPPVASELLDRPILAGGAALPADGSEAFDRAQLHAIHFVLEQIDADRLPKTYPPEPAELAERERTVDRALDSIGSDGSLEGVDRDAVMRLVTYELVGLGPIELYLDDPTIDRVYVNAFDRVFLRRSGHSVPASRVFSDPATLDLAVQRLLSVGKSVDGVLTVVRLTDGTRIDVVLPPVAAAGPVISIRKAPSQLRSLEELVAAGAMSPGIAAFLTQAVQARRTVLIAGPGGAGKTEFLSAIAGTIPEGSRIVTVQDGGTLRLPQRSAVTLETSGSESSDGSALTYAMRLSPERLLVDGLGPGNSYAWILAAAYSAVGSVATITAHGDRDALARLESLALAATPLHSIRGVREQIARAVQYLVVLSALPGHPTRVAQVVEVQGLELDTLRLQDVFYYQPSGDELGGAFHPTGHIPAFCEELRRAGAEPDLSIFRT